MTTMSSFLFWLWAILDCLFFWVNTDIQFVTRMSHSFFYSQQKLILLNGGTMVPGDNIFVGLVILFQLLRYDVLRESK